MDRTLTFALAMLCVLLTTAAQIVLKLGVSNPALQTLLKSGATQSFLIRATFSPYVLGGLTLYVLSTIIWLLVLARADVSYAYPFVSIGFVLTALYAYYAMHEPMSLARIAGILLIYEWRVADCPLLIFKLLIFNKNAPGHADDACNGSETRR